MSRFVNRLHYVLLWEKILLHAEVRSFCRGFEVSRRDQLQERCFGSTYCMFCR